MKKLSSAADKPNFFSNQISQARRFYLDLNPPRTTRLAVICGGVEHCAPDYVINRLSFPFYSVEFVLRGSGRLKLNDSRYTLQPGSVFAYGPDIPHEMTNSPYQPLVKYFVDFMGTAAAKLLRDAGLQLGMMLQVFPPTEIQPLFDELIRNGARGTRRTPEICARLLESLTLKIIDACAPLPGRETFAFATYQQCRDYISRHFLRLRSLEQVGEECHLDVAYLCRLFQRYDHLTPYRFLLRLKMNHAVERLQSPEVMVKQVAEETGFTNQFHFSRVFKSVFGVSPQALTKIR